MPQYYNDEQLTKGLVSIMSGVMESVAQKLLDLLADDAGLIDTIIYQANSPKAYARQGDSGGLLGMWEKKPLKSSGRGISYQIYADSDLLSHDPDDFIHGSNYWIGGDDIRDMLIDLVAGGGSGPLFGSGFWTAARDFWTPFLEMLENGTVNKILESEFKKRGIVYIKV